MEARTGASFAVYRRETSRWSRVKRSGCKQTKFDIQAVHLALNAVLRQFKCIIVFISYKFDFIKLRVLWYTVISSPLNIERYTGIFPVLKILVNEKLNEAMTTVYGIFKLAIKISIFEIKNQSKQR